MRRDGDCESAQVQVCKKWLRKMAQPFTQQDQLGVSMLTYDQLMHEKAHGSLDRDSDDEHMAV